MSHYSGEVKFVDAGVKIWEGLGAEYEEKKDHFEVKTIFNPSVALHNGKRYVSFRKATGFFEKDENGKKGRQYSYESTLCLATIKDDNTLTPVVELKGNHPIEDVRIFSRPDGLYGVGTVWGFGVEDGIKVGLCIIDPEKKTYEVLEQYPSPHGTSRTEKNWSPTEDWDREFDYVYSPTAVLRSGRYFPISDHNDDKVRGGSQLLRYKNDQWVSVRHILRSVKTGFNGGSIRKFYSTVVCIHNFAGYITHISEPFHMGAGERMGWWRAGRTEKPGENEFIEYVSGAIWEEKNESLFVTMGLIDELCGYGVINLSDLTFNEYHPDDFYYNLTVVPEDLSRAVV